MFEEGEETAPDIETPRNERVSGPIVPPNPHTTDYLSSALSNALSSLLYYPTPVPLSFSSITDQHDIVALPNGFFLCFR